MWKRVVAPTVLVSILWIAGSLITTFHLQRISESHVRTIAENVSTIGAGWAMRRDVWKLHAAVIAAANEPSQPLFKDVTKARQTFLESLAEAEGSSFTQPELALVRTIRQSFEAYQDYIDLTLGRDATTPGSQELDREQSTKMAAAVADQCRQLISVNQTLIDQDLAANRQSQVTLNVVRLVFLIAGPLVGLGLGMLIARGLSRSLSRIKVTLTDATGRLGCDLGSVALKSADDLPALHKQVQIVGARIRQVVDELEDVRRRAIQAERLAAVGELAAGVAHEIRNPLTSVKLLLQSAAERDSGASLNPKHLDVMLCEVLRMEATIQGLLDFARPPRPRREPHDIRETVRRALSLVEGRAQRQQVLIEPLLASQPMLVDGDRDLLGQVFVNLAINAIEAMPTGGVLRIEANMAAMHCRVSFGDVGRGFPPDVLARLFEPFVTSKERGTGLGLAISRRIVQEHGGTLYAANRPGGGALLTVELECVSTSTGSQAGQSLLATPRETAAERYSST